jgi:hypothetical protein
VFSVLSVPRLYNTSPLAAKKRSHVEAESNTSTVTLRVVGGDVKGSLVSETVNMVTSPPGLGPENDCTAEGQQQLQMTDPASRQRKCPTLTNPQLSECNKNLVVSPRWVLYSKTDWPTDRRS